MIVRLEDDCDILNMEFSLSGSSRAINYVYGDYAEKISKGIQALEAKTGYTSGPALLQLKPGSGYVILWDEPRVVGNPWLLYWPEDFSGGRLNE